MATTTTPITWSGNYIFRINGSGLHEDTLRIKSNYLKIEHLLRLTLPTLCITYADAGFQDSIGGKQENYSASQVYGQTYFDPPIEILGENEIEKFTYIRGAQRVEINPEKTVIEFSPWQDLVIPRLRLDQIKPVEADLHVPNTLISIDKPLKVDAIQYADGRNVGGVRLEKRHPDWKQSVTKEIYSLSIRVIDGLTLKPLPKTKVEIWHWDSKDSTPHGTGGFRLDESAYTDENGYIQIANRPSGEIEAYIVGQSGSRAVVHCLRPLAGQKVRLHMRVWPLKKSSMLIDRQSYVAEYQLEPWDTLDKVAKTYGYQDAKGLAEANGLKDVKDLYGKSGVKLPDWHFFTAQEQDTLENFDTMLGLFKGSSITIGRNFHPGPRFPFPGEIVAAPTPLFAEKMKKR